MHIFVFFFVIKKSRKQSQVYKHPFKIILDLRKNKMSKDLDPTGGMFSGKS